MVLKVTLILNSKMNLVTKFQVSIFKNDENGGGGSFNPPLRRISWLRGLRGIGLIFELNVFIKKISRSNFRLRSGSLVQGSTFLL